MVLSKESKIGASKNELVTTTNLFITSFFFSDGDKVIVDITKMLQSYVQVGILLNKYASTSPLVSTVVPAFTTHKVRATFTALFGAMVQK